ncbi:hypothetical protein AC480_05815 [miscellaneous Crenarchaeota group archaeon SMTZ1-55]|nr:MAG: hypothetical protein AC480_05815 [miscellaneous Crenarchaeota group archaeon SMTZ1-55]
MFAYVQRRRKVTIINNFVIQSFIYYKVLYSQYKAVRKMPIAIWIILFVIGPFLTIFLPTMRKNKEQSPKTQSNNE